MKEFALKIKKWSVRAVVATGALLGLSSCGGFFSTPKVYGPPPSNDSIMVDDTSDSTVENLDTTNSAESILRNHNKNEGGNQ